MKARNYVALAGLIALALVLARGAAGGGQVERLECLGEQPTIIGTPGDDVLSGTSDEDVILGLDGNDVIFGGDDGDVICGGNGNDRILTGDDGLFSYDVASGDDGDDVISAGSDYAFVAYVDAPGPVAVDLQAGTATGWGTDTLVRVNGVVGSRFDDTISGDADSNCLDGMAGNDVISSGAGRDCLYGDAGDDTLDGGPGSDWVGFYDAPNGVRVNLAKGTATGEGADRLLGIENVEGSRFGDAITGNTATNVLEGEGGADRIAAGPGADRVDAGKGKDRVDGGTGRDRCLNAETRVRCP